MSALLPLWGTVATVPCLPALLAALLSADVYYRSLHENSKQSGGCHLFCGNILELAQLTITSNLCSAQTRTHEPNGGRAVLDDNASDAPAD